VSKQNKIISTGSPTAVPEALKKPEPTWRPQKTQVCPKEISYASLKCT
jgi:hypothetical protein